MIKLVTFFGMALALLLTTSCGRKDVNTVLGLPQDQPEAQRYFRRFQLDRKSVPLIGGIGAYLQSAPFTVASEKDSFGKLNLFLLDDDIFLLEYTEIEDYQKGEPVQGVLRGAVIEGKWFVEGTDLVLKAGRNEVGRGKGLYIEAQKKEGVLLTVKQDWRELNNDLHAKKLDAAVELTFKGDKRHLPHDLQKDLPKELFSASKKSQTEPQGFKD